MSLSPICTTTPTIKRLTPDEIQDRCDKGLCFNCNEKFQPGYRCKKLFYLEGCWPEEGEEGYDHDDEAGEFHEEMDGETPEISIHAISRDHVPQTMCVRGNMGRQTFTVSVDSSSTHNFLSSSLAKRVGLVPSSEGHLEVAVANGDKMASPGRWKG
eukprot:TRINITY_DN202_c0_g1_i10.p1 TRINITY_DN202_c0_g1~~TRINITY_DN202_c0_g1_i10.p1  ORF type:complete len:156 (-),score=34.13 TRINITY_DN202_c0_g1_i10:242-709(-)